jgi:CDP-glucose 4,6-dehydratase
MDLKLGEQLRALPGPILITGHTGFKGTWLTFLLEHLGVSTVGYSLAPEKDCLYDRAQLTGKIPEIYADIRDLETFRKFLGTHKPSAIIHMAAQPLVLQSYKTPRETFDVNIMGTVNVLNEAFAADFVEAVIVVTTDKVYRNDNSGRAFVETDPLEGKDPYSASTVGAEAAVSAWQQIQKVSGGPKVVSVRAGNVIGGGDWAENRLIPDLVRGFISGEPVEIRNPESTRPWQHVLEPLVGYLMTLEYVLDGGTISSINFAPNGENLSVREITKIAQESWEAETEIRLVKTNDKSQVESLNLKLNSDYSKRIFPQLKKIDQVSAVQHSILWWKNVNCENSSHREECFRDVISYFNA